MTLSFPRKTSDVPMRPAAVQQWIEHWIGNSPAAPVAADLRAAVIAAQKDYSTVFETHARIASDRTLTEPARLVRQAKFAKTKMAAAFDRIAAAKSKAADARARLDKEIAAPFDFKDRRFADVELAAEIRSYFRALPQSERFARVGTAVQQKDLKTLVAIGAAPSYLTGLPDELHALARNAVLAVEAPQFVETREALNDAEAFVAQFEQTILHSVGNLVDFATAETFERSATTEAA